MSKFLGIVAMVAGTSGSAMAFEDEGASEDFPVLIEQQRGGARAHQLSLLYSSSVAPKFLIGQGGFAAYQYNLSALFGLELSGGWFATDEANVVDRVRLLAGEPALSDLYQLEKAIHLAVVFVPIYGRLSFFSTLDPSFDVFLVGGVGPAWATREFAEAGVLVGERVLKASFHIGVGARVYFSQWAALRLEFRDFLFRDPDPRHGGLTAAFHFQGGLQLSFGGGSE